MEIRKQRNNPSTTQNPSLVWPRSPGAWHRNPCLTHQPENLLRIGLQNCAESSEDAVLFYKMHSAPFLFSKIVPEQGGKKLVCAGISHPQDLLNVCVRVCVQTDLGCQGIGAAHRQALYFSKLETLSDPLTLAYGAKVEEIQGMSENAGV